MQFSFNFRLFSYIRIYLLRQNLLEWSGLHVVLISQLKVFLKINLVITVINRGFYDLFGSVPTLSWLFFTLWQVKILFYWDDDNRWFQSLTQLPSVISCYYLCCLLRVLWTDRTYKVTTKVEPGGNVLNITTLIIQQEQDSEQFNPKKTKWILRLLLVSL